MLLRETAGSLRASQEGLRVHVLVLHEPKDLDLDAGGVEDVLEDGEAGEHDLRLQVVGPQAQLYSCQLHSN